MKFFRKKPDGSWKLWITWLFFFSSHYGFGFRLCGAGLCFTIRGVHNLTFSQRMLPNKMRRIGPVFVEWLHPCNPGRAYLFVRGLFRKPRPLTNTK